MPMQCKCHLQHVHVHVPYLPREPLAQLAADALHVVSAVRAAGDASLEDVDERFERVPLRWVTTGIS